VKAVIFMPIAFIAGDHGFALFAPYLVFMFAILLLVRKVPRASRP
jgi:hypothetical protein